MDATEYLKVRYYIVEHLPSVRTNVMSTWIKRYLYKLVEQGWSRGHLFNLLWDIGMHGYGLTDEVLDYVVDFHTWLMGHCLSTLIEPFPGEPEDHDELIEYVGRGEWQEPRLEVGVGSIQLKRMHPIGSIFFHLTKLYFCLS